MASQENKNCSDKYSSKYYFESYLFKYYGYWEYCDNCTCPFKNYGYQTTCLRCKPIRFYDSKAQFGFCRSCNLVHKNYFKVFCKSCETKEYKLYR